MRFTTLFDNFNCDENLQRLWGFSCFIEMDSGKNLLFDTGSNGRVLLSNAQKIGVDFRDIDFVFISHPHWDHICGLDTVIEENPDITLILPSSLSKHYIKDLKEMVREVIVVDEFSELDFNMYSSGVMGEVGEQSLAIESNNKLYIISGCGHAGIDNIEKLFLDKLNKPVEYIMGGFHLFKSTPQEIKRVINNVNTKYITATHCTGDVAMGMIKVLYKNRFLDYGVGSVVEI